MPLIFINAGSEGTIERIAGTTDIKRHLAEIGFTQGEAVSVVQKIANGIIVRVKNTSIALDKAMASKIYCKVA